MSKENAPEQLHQAVNIGPEEELRQRVAVMEELLTDERAEKSRWMRKYIDLRDAMRAALER